jgi:Tol biopolymer transport system component
MTLKFVLRVSLISGILIMVMSAVLGITRADGESEAVFLAVASRDVSLTIRRFTVQGRSQILYHQDVYNPVDIDWSPDGRTLLLTLYHHFDIVGGRLIAVDVAGIHNRRIFSLPQIHSAAKWSPDGEEIVVIGATGFDEPLTLYRLRAEDGHVLKTYPLPDFNAIVRLDWVDGQTVRMSYLTSEGHRYGVLLDLNTGDITSQPDELHVPGILSPNGKWVVALEKQGSEYALVRTRPDGSERLVLTGETLAPAWADWSPDSQWISFTDLNVAVPSDVYRVRVDGSDLQPLTDNNRNNATLLPSSYISQPWSPDGRWRVFFSRDASGTPWELRLLDVERQRQIRLMDVLFEIRAEWSPPVDLPLHGWWLGLAGGLIMSVAVFTLAKSSSGGA